MHLFVQTIRTRLGLTQDELARRLGVTARTVSRWETGESSPTKLGLTALASFLKAGKRNGGALPPKVSRELGRIIRLASTAVRKAVLSGELPPVCSRYIRRGPDIPCVDCGAVAQNYDHRDYLKPLDVEPVCQACNANRGLAIYTFSDHPEHWKKFDWSS